MKHGWTSLAALLAFMFAHNSPGQAWTMRDPGLMGWAAGAASVPPPGPLAPPMANLSWWFKSDGGGVKNASGVACADGDAVAVWLNGGNSGDNLGNVTGGASGFVWRNAGGPHGMPTVAGTATAATRYLASYGGSGASAPFTCFMLVRVDSATGSPVIFCGYNAVGTIQLDYAGADGCGANQLVVYAPGSPFCRQALPGNLMLDWTVLTVCINGASSYVRVNGTQTTTFDIGLSPSNYAQLYFGNTFGGGAYEFLGEIPEVLIYRGRTFTEEDLTAVETTYLKAKYGL